MKLFEFTDNTRVVCGRKFTQIKAVKNFSDVKVGDLGGWVECEGSIGDGCWIYPDAIVCRDATVLGGRILGGKILGGRIYGGTIHGGTIRGGTIHGGTIRGGTIHDGIIHGGTIHGGTIRGGAIHDGIIYGGTIHDGIIHGGTIYGSTIDGGDISCGRFLDAVLIKTERSDQNKLGSKLGG